MGFFSSLFRKSFPLVNGEVKFIDEKAYTGISFCREDVKEIEVVWLCIYHFAKMMFITPASPETKVLINGLIHLDNNVDVESYLRDLDIHLVDSFNPESGTRYFKSVLSYKDIYSRKIKTSLPFHCTRVDCMRTILLLNMFAYNSCNERDRELLIKCLSRQANLYSNAVVPRKMSALIQTPVEVFRFGCSEVSE